MNKNESIIFQNVRIVKMRERTIHDSCQEDKIITVAAGSTGIDSGEDFGAITIVDIEGHGPTNIEYEERGNFLSIRLHGNAELKLIVKAFKSIVEVLEKTLPQDIQL